jgi:hypothetical protein
MRRRMAARTILRTRQRWLCTGSWESTPPTAGPPTAGPPTAGPPTAGPPTAGSRFCPDRDAAATKRAISPGRCPPGGHIRRSVRLGRRESVMTARIWLQPCLCGRSNGPATTPWSDLYPHPGRIDCSGRVRHRLQPDTPTTWAGDRPPGGFGRTCPPDGKERPRPRAPAPRPTHGPPASQDADRPRHSPLAPRNRPGAAYRGELRLGPGTMPAGPPETDQGLIRVSRPCATGGLRRSGEDRRRPREPR